MSISSLQSLLLFNSYYMNSVRKIHNNSVQTASSENKVDEHLTINDKIGFNDVRFDFSLKKNPIFLPLT